MTQAGRSGRDSIVKLGGRKDRVFGFVDRQITGTVVKCQGQGCGEPSLLLFRQSPRQGTASLNVDTRWEGDLYDIEGAVVVESMIDRV